MDKAELARTLQPGDKKNANWVEAFRLFKEEFPNSTEEVGCRSCRQKILKWLKRD